MKNKIRNTLAFIALFQFVSVIIILIRLIWVGYSEYGLRVFLTNILLFYLFKFMMPKADKEEIKKDSKSKFKKKLEKAMKESEINKLKTE